MIDIQNVTKTYHRGTTEVRALRSLSCTIPAGVMSFSVGPNGSGKSSLLYLLGALDQPTSGEIVCLGQRLSQLTSRQRDEYRRNHVGFVFQNFNLLSNLTAVENVLVPFLPQGIAPARHTEALDL